MIIKNLVIEAEDAEWLKRMRHSMATLVSQFTTDRMVKEYTTKYYQPK